MRAARIPSWRSRLTGGAATLRGAEPEAVAGSPSPPPTPPGAPFSNSPLTGVSAELLDTQRLPQFFFFVLKRWVEVVFINIYETKGDNIMKSFGSEEKK
uniref:Uncharacterized protein n=1 Tax=Sphaerodactylus townsendi TaxID=933632 RepID=A0ACB8FX82_9SAUR